MRLKKNRGGIGRACFYPRGNRQDSSVAVVSRTSWGFRRREVARSASDVAWVGFRGIAGGA